MAMSKMKGKKEKILHEAVVPRSVIEHTKSFTAPRGRMEMGGLLFGHVDSEGRNVCVVGFFPKQTQETPSYCEFEGKWLAIGAAAAVSANSKDNENDIRNPSHVDPYASRSGHFPVRNRRLHIQAEHEFLTRW